MYLMDVNIRIHFSLHIHSHTFFSLTKREIIRWLAYKYRINKLQQQ